MTNAKQAPLDSRRQLLLAKFESMTTMAAGIAHDFNNQAAAILGNNTLVARQPALEPRTRDCVARIDAAAHLTLQLAEQLATYAGRINNEPQPLSLPPLLATTLQSVQAELPPGIRVVQDMSPAPSCLADAALLARALRNLLTNAYEAMLDNSGLITLSAGAYHPTREDAALAFFPYAPGADWVVLGVRDPGNGIAPAILHRVFDPFFSTKIRGRGMGLPEVVGIMNLHGGNLLLSSTPGQGTDVRLILPPQPPT